MDAYADSLFHEITAAKCEKADLDAHVKTLKHLTELQQQQLLAVFKNHEPLFNGKVGKFPREAHSDVDPEAEPHHHPRPHPVNHANMEVLKNELDRQETLGIVSKVHEPTAWCMPVFPREKKDGAIRTVHDFRWLNGAMRRRIHTVPKIEDLLFNVRECECLTKIDISMQCYAFWLDEESSWCCVFSTPFGKHKLNRLGMGCVQSGDIAQAAMEEAFRDLLHIVKVCMDDILFHHADWDEHLLMIDEVLRRLQEFGFAVNPLKCEWGVAETDFLGCWITKTGTRPWEKRIEPMLKMLEPKTLKDLRRFVGLTNWHRHMHEKRAEALAPLTDMTKVDQRAFKKHWSSDQVQAFKAAKTMVAQDALLAHPDPNDEFVIEADASDYQLGAAIKQKGKPTAHHSRKLTEPQKKHSAIEKELLAILETVEQFRPFLWGRKITI